MFIIISIVMGFFLVKKINTEKNIHQNYSMKIIEVFDHYNKYDYYEDLDSFVNDVVSNNIEFNNDFTKGRFLYLNFIKDFTTNSTIVNSYHELFQIINLAIENDDKELEAISYHTLSVLENYFDNNDRGIIYSQKALELIESNGYKHQLIDIYFNIANSSIKLGRWKDVIYNADKSFELIKIFEFKKNRKPYLHILKASAYIQLDKHHLAIYELEKAEILSPTNSSVLLKLHLTYATLYKKEKKFEQSNIEIKQHLELIQNIIGFSNSNSVIIKNKILSIKDNISSNKDDLITIYIVLILILIIFLISTTYFVFKKKLISKKILLELNEKKKLRHELTKSIENYNIINYKLTENNRLLEETIKINNDTLLMNVADISFYESKLNKIEKLLSALIKTKKNIIPSDLFLIEKELSDLSTDKKIWIDFKAQFKKINPHFFKKLNYVSPNLSVNDLKHCTYIVAKLSTKEVASLINISYRSVETTRYRIKKKLNLDKHINLFDFLSSL